MNPRTITLSSNNGSLPIAGSTDLLIILNLHEVATAKLAVNCQDEERPIAEAMLLLKEEAHGPHLLRQERALGSNLTPAFLAGRSYCPGS